MTHIPYKAGAAQMTDLLGGVIEIMFEYPVVVRPQIDGGKLRPLGITSAARLKSFPDVRTIAEQGWPDVVLSAWSAILLPANTPPDVVNTLAAAFASTLRDPAIVKYFDDNDSPSLVAIGPDKLPAFMESEAAKFKRLVEISGASAD